MIQSLLRIGGFTLVGCAAIALVLVATQRPNGLSGTDGLDFSGVISIGSEPAPAPRNVAMRDGYDLLVREFPHSGKPNPEAPLIVMVHGSGWNGLQFSGLAAALQHRGRILVPDLRGHGAKPGRRGDVDYIGQFEDDLADLISAERGAARQVILLGHSSGGGLAVRMAGGSHGGLLDGVVLMAPFLKYNASTTRENSGGWAHVLTRRIIGLSMLNMVGIRDLNYLPVIEFNMPKSVLNGALGELATTQYSYRLNASYAPRSDFLSDIKSLPPFLVVVGADDEAFVAEAYEPLMSAVNETGEYLIVPETGHLDIVNAPKALAGLEEFLNGF